MCVKKPNPDGVLIEGEPIVNNETEVPQHEIPRPRGPQPIIPPALFNSAHNDRTSQRCYHCATKCLVPGRLDLALGMWDKEFCTCALQFMVNRLNRRLEKLERESCPNNFF